MGTSTAHSRSSRVWEASRTPSPGAALGPRPRAFLRAHSGRARPLPSPLLTRTLIGTGGGEEGGGKKRERTEMLASVRARAHVRHAPRLVQAHDLAEPRVLQRRPVYLRFRPGVSRAAARPRRARGRGALLVGAVRLPAPDTAGRGPSPVRDGRRGPGRRRFRVVFRMSAGGRFHGVAGSVRFARRHVPG